MSGRIKEAREYLARVPLPEMELGSDGTIWTKEGMKVATMNLRDLTLPQAFAFASAFIAAGDALATPDPQLDLSLRIREAAKGCLPGEGK